MEIGLPWLTLAFLLENGNLSTSTLAVKFLSLCRLKPPTFQIYTTTTFVLLYFTRYIFAKFPQLLGGTKISLLLLFLTSELPSFAAKILDGQFLQSPSPTSFTITAMQFSTMGLCLPQLILALFTHGILSKLVIFLRT